MWAKHLILWPFVWLDMKLFVDVLSNLLLVFSAGLQELLRLYNIVSANICSFSTNLGDLLLFYLLHSIVSCKYCQTKPNQDALYSLLAKPSWYVDKWHYEIKCLKREISLWLPSFAHANNPWNSCRYSAIADVIANMIIGIYHTHWQKNADELFSFIWF